MVVSLVLIDPDAVEYEALTAAKLAEAVVSTDAVDSKLVNLTLLLPD
jgi:hypothetical protein